MEGINFSALAPRYGSRPMLSSWSDIGTSSMNGGAFNWGSLWSGVKNVGSTIKNWGSRAWNSNTGQALRQKLKDTNLQNKVVEGLASGIHGAVDLANQEIARAVQQRLESRPVPEVLVEPPVAVEPAEEMIVEKPAIVPSAPVAVESVSKKRPSDEEELVITTDEPPRYEDIFPNNSAVPISLRPTAVRPAAPVVAVTKPAASASTSASTAAASTIAPVVTKPVVAVTRPPRRSSGRNPRGWQGTLNSIVGLGVHAIKRKRCF